MTQEDLSTKLASFACFKGVNAIDRSRITAAGMLLDCRSARALFYQGDRSDRAALVIIGHIDQVKYRSDGASLRMKIASPGDWVGLAETIASGPYLADAITRDECTVLMFTRERIVPLLALPACSSMMLSTLAREQYDVHSMLDQRSPEEKIISFLRSRVELNGGGHTVVEMTQEALAESIGYTRETVNKTLASLVKSGCISLERGKITVADASRLAPKG